LMKTKIKIINKKNKVLKVFRLYQYTLLEATNSCSLWLSFSSSREIMGDFVVLTIKLCDNAIASKRSGSLWSIHHEVVNYKRLVPLSTEIVRYSQIIEEMKKNL